MGHTRPSTPPRRQVAWAGALAVALLSALPFAPCALAESVEGLPYLYSVEIVGHRPAACDTCPPQVCAGRPIKVRIAGEITDGCVKYRGLRVIPQRGFPTALIVADFLADSCGVACPTVVTAFTDSVEVPGLVAGNFVQWVESHVRSCPDTNVVARAGARPFDFHVRSDCDPPSLEERLRSFLAFRVEPSPSCPLDTLSLEMATRGCPPCLDLVSFGPDVEGRPFAVVEWRPNCVNVACMPESLSFQLGQFQAGQHVVNVDVIAHVVDTAFPDSVIAFQVAVPFVVPQVCDTTSDLCVSPFLSAPRIKTGQCAAELPPAGEGPVTLSVHTTVPLGGLQGTIECGAPFRIMGVYAPISSSVPIHVSWTPEGRGARYVLFTDSGQPIPSGSSPVVTVGLSVDADAVPGTVTIMGPRVTLASDPRGNAVPLCDISNIRYGGESLCVTGPGQACDVNHDARSDVRDLVLMTGCLLLEPPVLPTDRCQDCDASGVWGFSDLLCCAEHVLGLPLPPRDSIGLGPQVTIEEVATDEVGTDIVVRITGADQLGGALLKLRYPGERWRGFDNRVVFGHATAGPGDGWFPIVDVRLPGVVRLGGLKLAADAASEMVFNLRFLPIAEPVTGDQLVVEGADLASSGGAAFTLGSLPRFTLSKPLPGISRVELGAPRPNPFQRTTSFRLSLPQPARVELTMHDLFGRRVATLLHGQVAAGQRDVPWDGAGQRDGIYFARLVIDGRVHTQRVALLRDRR